MARERRQPRRWNLPPEQLLEWVSDACLVLDRDGRCVYANPSAGALLGRRPEDLVGREVWAEIPGLTMPSFRAAAEQAVARQVPQRLEAYSEPLGHWLEIRFHPLPHERLLLLVDIGIQRLGDSERDERLRLLVEQVPAILWTTDRELRLRSIEGNPRVLVEVGRDRLIGHEVEEAMRLGRASPDETATAMRVHRQVLRGTASQYCSRFEGRLFQARLAPLRDASGEIAGVVGVGVDITEQQMREMQLRQAQKLEALGQLAGGVAHDFNNILAAITSYAQLLYEDASPDTVQREDAGEILKAAARASNIIRQLLAFSRHQTPQTESIDLAALVQEMRVMLRALLPASITLQTAVEPDSLPTWVRADRGQLEQIVMNLGVNARDAMPSGGELAITIGTDTLPDGAPAARLEVQDTGIGMSPEVRARIFEPFFTTKEPGQGTGLGLATVDGIVRQYGGTIEIASEEGRGTVVTIRLPLSLAPQT